MTSKAICISRMLQMQLGLWTLAILLCHVYAEDYKTNDNGMLHVPNET